VNTPALDPQKTQNAEDQFRLGRAYYRGEGVTQSYEQAGYWYRKAADQGNLKAMYNLGTMYLEGKGTKKSEKEGYALIHEAAEKGDLRARSLSGILLCRGTGVEQNTTEGLKILREAAKGGDPVALSQLGQQLLYNPDGGLRDPKEAIPYLRKAAEAGNPWACGTLGLLYRDGTGLTKDANQSVLWFTKGAQLGDPYSQFAYGSKLLAEKGTTQAYPWIKLASDGNCAAAKGLLLECQSNMSPEEIVRGDADAEKIEKTHHQ
jgi:TPR repeat protein